MEYGGKKGYQEEGRREYLTQLSTAFYSIERKHGGSQKRKKERSRQWRWMRFEDHAECQEEIE